MFFPVLLQLMEAGQIGVNGRLVASRVEVFKNVCEIVRVRSPDLAGNLAKEKIEKPMNARIFVKTYLTVCNEFHKACINFKFVARFSLFSVFIHPPFFTDYYFKPF